MREIKFRFYDEQLKKFHYWGFIGNSFVGLTNNNYNPKSLMEQEEQSQQFTGLVDKLGKEIYEGDFIGEKDFYQKIIFKNAAFRIESDNTPLQEWLWKRERKTEQDEVIGNIYEDGSLLDNK